MSSNCHICDKVIRYTTKLCDSPICHKVAQATEKRVIKQQNVYDALRIGKECKRCLVKVYESGMKKYCIKCDEEMNMKKCQTCTAMVQNTRIFCDECNEVRAKAAMDKQTATRKPKKKVKKSSGLNPKWLVRGPISSNSTACSISNAS